MAGISNHRCLMGTGTCIFGQWRHVDAIQTTTPPYLNTPITHAEALSMPHLTRELDLCLETVHKILDNLQDIKIGLERGLDISTFLSPDFSPLITFLPPPFDPFKTIGKYC